MTIEQGRALQPGTVVISSGGETFNLIAIDDPFAKLADVKGHTVWVTWASIEVVSGAAPYSAHM